MTRPSTGLRFVAAVVAVLATLTIVPARGFAQEDGSFGDAETVDAVYVSCVQDDSSGTSTCTFSPVLGGGFLIDAFIVWNFQLCGLTVTDAGAGEEIPGEGWRYYGDGTGAASATLTVQGYLAVAAEGGTTYTVESGGEAIEVVGPVLACTAPVEEPPVEDPPVEGPPVEDPPVEDPPPSGDPAPAGEVAVSFYVYDCPEAPLAVAPPEQPAGCTAAAGVVLYATIDGNDAGKATTDAGGWASVTAPVGSTVVVAEDAGTIAKGYAPAGDGTASVAAAEAGSAAVLIHILAAAEDELPATTDPEDEGSGEPGGPVLDAEEDEGLIQLVKGRCSTSDEPRTEMTVISPNTMRLQAQATDTCTEVPGAEFLVTGGDLPPAGETFVTEDDGAYRGVLTPGFYVVTEVASGEQTEEFEVIAGGIVIVVAVEYVAETSGTIAVQRYVCIEGVEETTSIVASTVAESPGENCAAEFGFYQVARIVDGVPGEPGETFGGGSNGSITFDLPIGSYVFTDLAVSLTTTIEIQEAATTFVTVSRLIPFGELSLVYAQCDDSDAYTGDAGDADYWAGECPSPTGGVALQLLDANGGVVGTAFTDPYGIARWSDLLPGTYRVRGVTGPSTCAVFVGGAPALAGVSVAANTLYQGSVYGCVIPAPGDGSGGNNTGGGNQTGGGNSTGGNSTGGGDNTGGSSPGGADSNGGNTGGTGTTAPTGGATAGVIGGPTVSTLPQTGAGSGEHTADGLTALLAAMVVVVAGLWTVRRRAV